MDFRVLGPVEIAHGDEGVAPLRAKERRLLAVLLANPNRAVSGDRLADALWPGAETPRDAVRSVHTHVSRVRSALGPASDRLETRSPGYLLRLLPGELDAERFEQRVDEARRRVHDEPARALAMLDEALALWRGPPYGELRDEDFALGDAVRLEELRLVAIEDRIDARLALGHHGELVGELEVLCGEHPLRERLRGQLMLALHRSGRQPEALRAYDAHRRLLAEELGLDPSPELRVLEGRILAHDPALAPRAAPAVGRRPVVTPVTRFVGRDGELAELVRRLSGARLLSLTGPGGVGKTRLALHGAAAVADRFADGVVVCELAGVTHEDGVAPAVANALGVQPRPDRTIEQSVADVLAPRQILLVVDNCEHVVDAAAALLSTLVAGCPHVVIVATSRERLGIEGEQVWPVGPLRADAAVELFCDRARAVRPDLECGGPAHEQIVEVCRRLDGVPLAIELAAAQLVAMNPADLVHRLDDRFRLLDRGARRGPGRHRSLRAVVDSSYERLGDPQRRLFDRLSVFAGGFTLEAAEDVCIGDGVDRADVPSLVADLVDVSLVALVAGGERTRYRILETLRSYGRERLDLENGERWRERHLEFFVDLARRAEIGLRGPDEGRWVRRLDAEFENLRTAHDWAVTHGDADRAVTLSAALHGYTYRTLSPELFARAEVAARMPGAAGHPLLSLALGSAATGAWGRGDLTGCRRLAEEAVEAAGGGPAGHLAFQALAAAALFGGDLPAARRYTRRAADLADAYGDQGLAVLNRVVEILAIAYEGETREAVERAESVLTTTARQLESPSAKGWVLYLLGETLLDTDPGRALPLLDEARELAASAGHVFLTGVAGTSAATLRARHEEAGDALGRFPDLIDLWDRTGNWTQQWTLLRSLIGTLARIGRDEPAAMLYGAMQASPTAAPLYGADADRLAGAVRTIEDRAGRDQAEAWVARGRRLDDREVVELARAAAAGSGATSTPGLSG